jgi:hypothetical protein
VRFVAGGSGNGRLDEIGVDCGRQAPAEEAPCDSDSSAVGDTVAGRAKFLLDPGNLAGVRSSYFQTKDGTSGYHADRAWVDA